MQQTPGFSPDNERQRSSLQLEEHEESVQNTIPPRFGAETTIDRKTGETQDKKNETGEGA